MISNNVPQVGRCMKPARTARMNSSHECMRPADAVAPAGLDPGVAVDVVGVGPAPLRDEVVLALEAGSSRVGVEHRPAHPAQRLLHHVGHAVGAVGLVGGEVVVIEAAADGGQPLARLGPCVLVVSHGAHPTVTTHEGPSAAPVQRAAGSGRRRAHHHDADVVAPGGADDVGDELFGAGLAVEVGRQRPHRPHQPIDAGVVGEPGLLDEPVGEGHQLELLGEHDVVLAPGALVQPEQGAAGMIEADDDCRRRAGAAGAGGRHGSRRARGWTGRRARRTRLRSCRAGWSPADGWPP